MKQVCGVWLPDSDQHLPAMLQASPRVDGRGTYQHAKWERVLPYLTQRRTALDIGAHVGLWTMSLAKTFQQVVAFEPVPDHVACFARNLDDRQYPNVTLHAVALSEVQGSALMTHGDRETSSRAQIATQPGEGRVQVPTMRLDEYDFREVDFIKVDCEGFEYAALSGGRELLRRERPLVLVEQKGHATKYGLSVLGAVRFLETLGGRVLWDVSGDFLVQVGGASSGTATSC